MPYIKEPDFAELCVVIEMIGEINGDDKIEKIVDKAQNILRRYKHE